MGRKLAHCVVLCALALSAPVVSAFESGAQCVVDEVSIQEHPSELIPDVGYFAGNHSEVSVALDPHGAVLDVTIARSSRNRSVDAAALRAARSWSYSCPPDASAPGRRLSIEVPVTFSRLSPAVADELADALWRDVLAPYAQRYVDLREDGIETPQRRACRALFRDYLRRDMRSRFENDVAGNDWLDYSRSATGQALLDRIRAAMVANILDYAEAPGRSALKLDAGTAALDAESTFFVSKALRPMSWPLRMVHTVSLEAAHVCTGGVAPGRETVVTMLMEEISKHQPEADPLQAKYEQAGRQQVLAAWGQHDRFSGHHCILAIRQLPGGAVVDARVDEACSLPAEERSALVAVAVGLTMPYEGFEHVFNRMLMIDVFDDEASGE